MSSIGFHEILFPLDVGFGASGGPERRTDIVTLASGFEERNSRWSRSRRSYDAGLGVRSFQDLQTILAFFEERRGRLYGFRFRDPLDHATVTTGRAVSPTDQVLAIGDGTTTCFQLIKRYGENHSPFERAITKPVAGTLRLALDGAEINDFSLDITTGRVTLPSAPPAGVEITAGFHFDVPVRFNTDQLEFSLAAFDAGDIPSIPLLEIRT